LCLLLLPLLLFLPIFNDFSLYCFKVDWPHSRISECMLNRKRFKGLLSNKGKISKKRSNVIFWHKSSNRIHKGYLLPVLPGSETAYI
jgi:hypothetical protein